MIEYVPNQAIQTILDDPKSYYNARTTRMRWECAKRVLEISEVAYDALLASHISDKLKGFRFLSEQPVQQVPFESYMLPVRMFDTKEPTYYDNTLLLDE